MKQFLHKAKEDQSVGFSVESFTYHDLGCFTVRIIETNPTGRL